MSAIIKFDLKDLKKLSGNKNSCVVEKKVAQNIALQPWCLRNPKESIKNLLDYKIGKFDKEFNGILMSYKNLRVLQNVGTIRNDSADICFQVQADYYIFQPYIGATLTGVVNKKSNTHLSILVHRVFNVVIPRPTEEPGNKWMGTNVKQGQEVKFQIVVLDLFGALPYIRGELDESSINLEQDGDEDDFIETSHTHHLNVSYVDFDKTKPHNIKKQSMEAIGDGVPQSSKIITKLSMSNRLKEYHTTSKTDYDAGTEDAKSRTNNQHAMDSQINISDKAKMKQQNIIINHNNKQTDLKPKKKKKRDV